MTRTHRLRAIAQTLPLVSRAWRQLADTLLAEFGVSNSMAWCLIYLDRLGPQARQTDLAQQIGITQPSTVRVLDQLEAAGLVDRVQDPEDKRSNRLVLTPEGRAQVGKIEGRLQDLRDLLFHGVPDSEVEATLRVLGTLSDRLTQRKS